MIALVLSRKGVDPGVVIIHGVTKEPVLKGDTAMSNMLLEKYLKGLKYYEKDRLGRRRLQRIPPKDYPKFITQGVDYFHKASLDLFPMEVTPGSETFEVNGRTCRLEGI